MHATCNEHGNAKPCDECAERPEVKLVGEDGNAFAIIGACQRAARRAGWTAERIDTVCAEMTAGDYDNLLMTVCKHFEVL